jgi:hypothetical protein
VHQGTLVHNTWVSDEQFKAEKVIPNVVKASGDAVQQRDLRFLRLLNERHLKG